MIESQIKSYLAEKLPDGTRQSTNGTKREIILHLLGFNEDAWPTLEATGIRFGGITRERVRQIVQAAKPTKQSKETLSSLYKCLEILDERPLWPVSLFLNRLVHLDLASSETNIKSIINSLEFTRISDDFALYDTNFNVFTRNSYKVDESGFVTRNNIATKLNLILNKVKKLPNRVGISSSARWPQSIPEWEKLEPHEKVAIRENLLEDINVWSMENANEELLYLVEGADNILVNTTEKVFSVLNVVPLAQLAPSLQRALSARTIPRGQKYPATETIREYVQTSRMMVLDENENVEFIGNEVKLNDIEVDLVAFVEENPGSNYPSIRDHLMKKGYGKPHLDKAIFTSAFLFRDESKGRRNYTYSLPREIVNPLSSRDERKERYKKFRNRMNQLEGTDLDIPTETYRRREQGILRDWLFEGISMEKCAVCGREYSVKALVAAHKKKRSKCTPAEKRDPNIVMPVCVFGCDYLYEAQHIAVIDGQVARQKSVRTLSESEREFVDNIENNTIEQRWVRGSERYFEAHHQGI